MSTYIGQLIKYEVDDFTVYHDIASDVLYFYKLFAKDKIKFDYYSHRIVWLKHKFDISVPDLLMSCGLIEQVLNATSNSENEKIQDFHRRLFECYNHIKEVIIPAVRQKQKEIVFKDFFVYSYNTEDFGELRFIDIDGEFYFLDRYLYFNSGFNWKHIPKFNNRVLEKDKKSIDIINDDGILCNRTFINKSGVFTVMNDRKMTNTRELYEWLKSTGFQGIAQDSFDYFHFKEFTIRVLNTANDIRFVALDVWRAISCRDKHAQSRFCKYLSKKDKLEVPASMIKNKYEPNEKILTLTAQGILLFMFNFKMFNSPRYYQIIDNLTVSKACKTDIIVRAAF